MKRKHEDYVKDWVVNGLRCRVLAGPFKNYNGYVALTENHSCYQKEYYNIDVDVHGGLTFGGQGNDNSLHFPDSKVYWVGFDTSHLSDYIEYDNDEHPEPNGIKWTKEMVAEETERLAIQLSKL